MMHVNKIYLHASLAFLSLVFSVIFHEEKEMNVTGIRYLFALATIINLICQGFMWISIQSAKPATNGDDEVKTVTVQVADHENVLPFPNPFDKEVKRGTLEITHNEYDNHLLISTFVLYAIIAVVALLYHIVKNNLLVLIWYSAFTVINTILSPLFQAHILRQPMGRPFRTPTLKDDMNEIKKSFQQVQRELKNELKSMGDDLHGPAKKSKK